MILIQDQTETQINENSFYWNGRFFTSYAEVFD